MKTTIEQLGEFDYQITEHFKYFHKLLQSKNGNFIYNQKEQFTGLLDDFLLKTKNEFKDFDTAKVEQEIISFKNNKNATITNAETLLNSMRVFVQGEIMKFNDNKIKKK